MNIEDIEDILIDLKDEGIEYKIDIFNDNRQGWCGWLTQRINVSILRTNYNEECIENSIEHLTNYVRDMGYSIEVDFESYYNKTTREFQKRIIKYSRNIKDKRKR